VRKRVLAAIQNDPGSELVAACRGDSSRVESFCADHGIPRACATFEELAADADIDCVYLATPVHLHRPHTLAAAAAGKHVLCEKPMALSAAECDEMIAACREHGVRLGVAYYRRFYPALDRIRQWLAEGAIGRPLAVSAVTATPFAIAPGEEGYWRVIPEQGGGGSLMDIGSHRLDLFLDLFGPLSQVQAICSTVAAAYDSEDAATLSLRFDSGLHGSLQCFFGAKIDPDELSIIGLEGRIVARTLNQGRLLLERADSVVEERHPPAANFHAPLVADFVAAVQGGREPTITGEQGRAVNELMERAYASADTRFPPSRE